MSSARANTSATPRTLEELVRETAALVRPPERLSVAEAAEKYRKLNNPGSYVGPWDNDFAPYLVEPMEVLTSLEFQGMAFVGPVRSGKSDIFFNWLGHTAICDPADMMVVHMTQNTARDWSKGDLQKVFRHSPDIGATVLPGKQHQNTHDVTFRNGMRLLVKWPTVTELSGKTIPRLWLMDYDRMPLDVDQEGSPFDLASRRAVSFRRYGMTVAESSPGHPVEDPKFVPKLPHQAPPAPGIISLYNRGDRRRLYWPCPHCGVPFEPDFDLLRWPSSADIKESVEGVYMACPHCFDKTGAMITPDMKHELNKAHKWVKAGQRWDGKNVTGTPVESTIASFWLKGPAAAFATWGNLVNNWLRAMEEYEATGSQEALKTTITTDQGKPYVPITLSDHRLPEDLMSRAMNIGERVVPPGVRFLTAVADVQKNCFVVQVHGHLPGNDTVVIDRFEIRKSERLDPDGERYWVNPGAYPEDWDLLIDQMILASYPLADNSGRRMSIRASASDSGGREGVTTNAYDFWRRLRDDEHGRNLHRRFRLLKGDPRKGAPRVQVSYPDSTRKDRKAGARGEVPVLIINTDMIKDHVDKRLDRLDPGGGMYIFPDWLDEKFYQELVAETRTAKGWENPQKRRNESWDLLCYDLALCLDALVRIEHLDWDNPPTWAEEWDHNNLVFDGEINRMFESQPKDDYKLSDLAKTLA